jgi:hypothetical protein
VLISLDPLNVSLFADRELLLAPAAFNALPTSPARNGLVRSQRRGIIFSRMVASDVEDAGTFVSGVSNRGDGNEAAARSRLALQQVFQATPDFLPHRNIGADPGGS